MIVRKTAKHFDEWFAKWVRKSRHKANAHLVSEGGVAISELQKTFNKATGSRLGQSKFKEYMWDYCKENPDIKYNDHLAWKGDSMTARRWLRGPKGKQVETVVITTINDLKEQLVLGESAILAALENQYQAKIEAQVIKAAKRLLAKYRSEKYKTALKAMSQRPGLSKSKKMKLAHALETTGAIPDDYKGETLEELLSALSRIGSDEVNLSEWYNNAFDVVKVPRQLAVHQKRLEEEEKQQKMRSANVFERASNKARRKTISDDVAKKFRF